ncbi:MAG: hypothetical protein WCC45_19105 [Paeniglutamicibacter sp.]
MCEIAGEVGGALWIPLAIALVLAMLTADSYAGLVARYPKAGDAAVFAERDFNWPWISSLVGFSMLAAGGSSAAGLSIAFAGDYLKPFLDVPALPAAIVFLLLVALLSARGIKELVRANVLMTAIQVSGLLRVLVLTGAGSRTTANQDNERTERRSGNWAIDAVPRAVDDIEPH